MFSIDRWGTVRRMEHGPPPPPTKDQLKAKRGMISYHCSTNYSLSFELLY
jgi:hypothetical protein